jgi:hypothetical protein
MRTVYQFKYVFSHMSAGHWLFLMGELVRFPCDRSFVVAIISDGHFTRVQYRQPNNVAWLATSLLYSSTLEEALHVLFSKLKFRLCCLSTVLPGQLSLRNLSNHVYIDLSMAIPSERDTHSNPLLSNPLHLLTYNLYLLRSPHHFPIASIDI